jgi:hypothetical protein
VRERHDDGANRIVAEWKPGGIGPNDRRIAGAGDPELVGRDIDADQAMTALGPLREVQPGAASDVDADGVDGIGRAE